MKNLLALLCFFSTSSLTSFQVTAQSVQGKVLDSATAMPLANATVSFLGINTKRKFSQLTTVQGIFRFDSMPVGPYIFVVSHVGFITKTLPFDTNQSANLMIFNLVRRSDTLDSVSIRTSGLQITRTFDKMIVGVENTALTAMGSTFDLLQKMPGAILQQDGILLLNGKLVDVWVDGRPTHLYGAELRSFINSLPSTNVSRVELISNPSAIYDAQASAIINIITRKIRTLGWNGTFSAVSGYGKHARYYPSGTFNFRKQKVNLYGTVNYQRAKERVRVESDRFADLRTGKALIYTNETSTSINSINGIKLGVDIDLNKNNYLGVLAFANANKIDGMLTNDRFIQKQIGITDSLIRLSNDGKIEFNNASFNLYYKRKFDSLGTELVFNLDYWSVANSQRQDYQNSFWNINQVKYREDSIFRNRVDGSNRIYALKADFTLPRKNGKILAGVKTLLTNRDNELLWDRFLASVWSTDIGRTSHFLYDENINSVYIGAEKRKNKIQYQLIARVEQTNIQGNSLTIRNVFSRSYIHFFPSLNFQFDATPHNQFNLSYRRSISRPRFTLLDPFVQFENQYSYIVGNPDLKPELSQSVELSHSLNRVLFSSISYTDAKDVFSKVYLTDSSDQSLIATYSNLSAANRIGLNLSYNKMLTKIWMTSTSLNASYNRVNTLFRNSVIKNEGTGVNLFSFNNFTLAKNYSLNLFLAYSSRYRGTIFQYKSSGFLNIGAQKQLPKSRASISILIADVFGTNRVGYTTSYDRVAFDYTHYPDSRFVNLSFTIRLGNQKLRQNENRNSGIETEKSRMKTLN